MSHLMPVDLHPIDPVWIFSRADLPLDVAVLICLYLDMERVEALGSTNRAARARYLAIKDRVDFRSQIRILPRFWMRDWAQPDREVKFSHDVPWYLSITPRLNCKGDWMLAHADDSTFVLRRKSQDPLKYSREGKPFRWDGHVPNIQGIDQDSNNPGFYFFDSKEEGKPLKSWHLKTGVSTIGVLPESQQLVVNSYGGSRISLNVITMEGRLLAQTLAAQGMTYTPIGPTIVQEVAGMKHIKLSPGGHVLMVLCKDSPSLRLFHAQTLEPIPTNITLVNFGDIHNLSVTDCGGMLIYAGQVHPLDPNIPLTIDGVGMMQRTIHNGSGKIMLTACFKRVARASQTTLMSAHHPNPLHNAIFCLVNAKACSNSNVTLYVYHHHLSWIRENYQKAPINAALRRVTQELRGATASRLAVLCAELQPRLVQGFSLFLFDLANQVDWDNPNFQHLSVHWCTNNSKGLKDLVSQYRVGRSKKATLIKQLLETQWESGNVLIDLCVKITDEFTLADVLCFSRTKRDQDKHIHLVPRHLEDAMIKNSFLRNYLILAALLRKLVRWMADSNDAPRITNVCKRMVAAAEANQALHYNSEALLTTEFEGKESVVDCLRELPYFDALLEAFAVKIKEPIQRLDLKW